MKEQWCENVNCSSEDITRPIYAICLLPLALKPAISQSPNNSGYAEGIWVSFIASHPPHLNSTEFSPSSSLPPPVLQSIRLAPLVLENDVERVDDAWDVAQYCISASVCCCNIWFGDHRGCLLVRRMLMRRSAPQPRSRKTPRGGRRTAKMILMMSLQSLVSACRVLVVATRLRSHLPSGECHCV